MLSTEEYAKQIREQKIEELHELIRKKKYEIEDNWHNNLQNEIVNDDLLDRDIRLSVEYLRLLRKYLRLKGVIKT